uniref:Mediator of RNA polymerase II transcription subunit 12 n=1 Tax=Blastobotrys adeninivorans TaxID=409370 RepID=A0A060T5S7_BLAAD
MPLHLERKHTLAPPGRPPGPGSSRNREELAGQRYLLSEPQGVQPYPAGPGHGGRKVYPDFFPWQHSQQEDELVVECVQKGYYQAPMLNENASSRSAMIPLIKQWTSLPALSYFLLQSMEVREKKCRVPATSTFKPPPRVTLTDHKREAWLRDLATPSVPLRRLSRTIPHGIRNKTLLEQCCAKNVPISRALWFARCVGTNELRGLKRKGNASVSEAAWLAEWTDDVVSFVEKTAKEFDPNNKTQWRDRVEYTTSFFTYLYHEDLLDRAIVFNWALRYFKGCNPEQLPMSLVFIKMFWPQLSSSEAYAQKLAQALLQQYSVINAQIGSNVSDAIDNLLGSIALCLRNLLQSYPDAFVIPKHWRSLGPVLIDAIKPDSVEMDQCLQTLRIRNESLITSEAPLVRAQRDHKAVLVNMFDSMNSPHDFKKFFKALRGWSLTTEDVCHALFDWVVTTKRSQRDASFRVYCCLALCQTWIQHPTQHLSSAALANYFRNFLVRIHDFDTYCMGTLYDLIAEFLVHDLMALELYFRGLISSGILFIPRLRHAAHGHVSILYNLPLHSYGPEYQNQRQLLIRGMHLEDEVDQNMMTFDDAQQLILQHLPFLDNSSHDYDQSFPPQLCTLASLSKGTKVQLCRWVLETVQATVAETSNGTDACQLALIAQLCSTLHGFPTFVEIMEIVLPVTYSMPPLHFLAGFINANIRTVSMLTEITKLAYSMIVQLKSLKLKSKVSKPIVDLINYVLAKGAISADIKAELESIVKPSNHPSPLDISKMSPMSEPVVGEGQSTDDVVEAIASLAVTPSNEPLDSRYMQRHGETLLTKLWESAGEPDSNNMRKIARILQHLKDNDSVFFAECLAKWLNVTLERASPTDSEIIYSAILMLLVYECVGIDKIVEFSFTVQESSPAAWSALSNVATRLLFSKPSHLDLSSLELEMLEFQVMVFQNTRYQAVLKLLRYTSCSPADWPSSVMEFFTGVCHTDIEAVMSLFISPLLSSLEKVSELTLTFEKLIFGESNAFDDDQSLANRLFHLASSVNVYNVTLCQVQTRLLADQAIHSNGNDAQGEADLVNTILDCARRCKLNNIPKNQLGDLVAHLSESVKGRILYRVEETFLSSADFPHVYVADELGQSKGFVDYLLEILDACADCAMFSLYDGSSSWLQTSLDKLIGLATKASTGDSNDDDFLTGVLLLFKTVIIEFQSFVPDRKVKDELVRSLMKLSNTPYFQQNASLHGSLMDTLNAIGGDDAASEEDPAARSGKLIDATDLTRSDPPTVLTDLLVFDRANQTYRDLSVRSFDLLEEPNPSMSVNDVPINLALFDSVIDKSDP